MPTTPARTAHSAVGNREALDSPRLPLHAQPLTVPIDVNPDAQLKRASTLLADGRLSEALVTLFDAVYTNRSHVALRQLLVDALQGIALGTASDRVREVLRDLIIDRGISAQSLAGVVLGLIRGTPAFGELTRAVQLNADRTAAHDLIAAHPEAARSFMRDDVLLVALPRIIVSDPDVERLLTRLRHDVLLYERAAHDDAIPLDFVCALAGLGFNEEYAPAWTTAEYARVASLQSALARSLAEPHFEPPSATSALALVAMYQPLTSIVGWERLADVSMSQWPPAFAPIVSDHLHAYREERRIAAQLPVLTPITDAVSQLVREQYEANPYPRWLTLQRPPVTTVSAFIRSLRPELRKPVKNVQLLVAGCGSGQQALSTAISFSDAQVTAFDLSAASLAYATRMASRYEVRNVTFGQGDILEFEGHDQEFAIVSCSGVLHHLHNPLDGWRRLVDALAPDGVMKIGLYSTLARPSVDAARRFARDHGFATTDDGIRECRQAILSLPVDHPARGAVAFVDFFSLSGCRDLVMHVQERTYTVPEIRAHLGELGLRFLGFQLPPSVRVLFVDEHGPSAWLDLKVWAQFEIAHPDTFAAMYQFWCCKR